MKQLSQPHPLLDHLSYYKFEHAYLLADPIGWS
jgi:hypothetical protein